MELEKEPMISSSKKLSSVSIVSITYFQALNWLLRSVTQIVCLHDLMWFFVASLTPPSEEEEEEEEEPEKGKEKEKKKKEPKKDQEVGVVGFEEKKELYYDT